MKRPLIIGYGNPLREDDGLGWRAAEILEAQFETGTIDFVQCHQLTPELAARVAEAAITVFLDAAADQHPGAVRCEVVSTESDHAWSHHVTPGQLLHLARQLGEPAPRAVAITGGPFRMDFGDQLSEAGEQCAKEMAETALLAISGQL